MNVQYGFFIFNTEHTQINSVIYKTEVCDIVFNNISLTLKKMEKMCISACLKVRKWWRKNTNYGQHMQGMIPFPHMNKKQGCKYSA
jgi:hypothetical protein